jgi:hypothetical protein
MAIEKVLAGVAVYDFDSARGWYGRLLGRAPDAEPMEGLAEWHPSEHGGIQLLEDGERAGSSLVTVVVDGLDERLAPRAGDRGYGAAGRGALVPAELSP